MEDRYRLLTRQFFEDPLPDAPQDARWSGDPAHQNLVITNLSPYFGWVYNTIRAHMSSIQPGQPIVPWSGPAGNFSSDWRPTLAP